MTEPFKFFKVDHTTIYQDGFSYSFYRDLDPPKSSADLQLHQSFHCALRTQEQNCRSRCHVTGNWQMDKKGSKFMLGIVKKADHTHGPEYRDTTPKFKFYKNNDGILHRNGFDYSLYRELDPPKQIADFQWHQTYRCSMSDQENCRARIYTTGQWEKNKRDLKYQLGIFKNCIHSHGSDQEPTEENKENNIVTSASSSTHTLDKKEQIRFYKYKETCVQHNGFVYSQTGDVKSHPQWKFHMHCRRKINGKRRCTGYIWTTGKWEEDDRGREFQIGIIMNNEHNHEPHQIAFQGKDNDDESKLFDLITISCIFKILLAPEAGLKFYKYIDKKVHRDGHVYFFVANLKSRPPWKHRMRCTRRSKIKNKKLCNGAIWTTGEWETDNRGRLYQRGILRGGHSHKAFEQFLNEDDTAFIGNGDPMDDKDGFSYSFYRDLDPPKSSADLQLHQSFHCALRSAQEQNCRSRCHVTGNWQMDKKGSKFMLGIVKKADHTHGPEYRDTVRKFKFYKNNDESLHRNGFDYSLYRELDPPKQIADLQWHEAYRCSMSDQENCRARIYTTGQWEKNKRGLEYQLGIFKNCFHNHGSDQDSNDENKNGNSITASSSTHAMDPMRELQYKLDIVKKNLEEASAKEQMLKIKRERTKNLDKKERIRFYRHKTASVQHGGFVYNYNVKLNKHADWMHRMYCNRQVKGKHTCTGYIWTTGEWEEDERGREFQIGIVIMGHNHEPHQEKTVHRDGFTYYVFSNLTSHPPWKQRMRCTRRKDGTKKSQCNGMIWTTGEWETDSHGRLYQRGILRGKHSHEAYEQFLNEDDTAFARSGDPMDDEIEFQGNDDDYETPDAGLKFYKYKGKTVHRDGHVYCFNTELKNRPPWKQRMRCSRHIYIGDYKKVRCNAGVWTTGEWETDRQGRLYQRGVLRGQHFHKAYEASLE
ncbi:hypothetical protein DdX_13746 [Ditylenchus destructor]|uniref:Uncharacterized protein n=1 Tax=Ditylenchus destructor TaxID=166010 RepID=A0AAD4MY69_9BILA|nr:hypothetical protein DdX_13746 [Ditylenchus destructor]